MKASNQPHTQRPQAAWPALQSITSDWSIADLLRNTRIAAALGVVITLAGCATIDSDPTNCRPPSAVIAATPQEMVFYHDTWHYAPAVRAGDLVVFSGVPVAAARPDTVMGAQALRVAIRTALDSLGKTLKAAGGSFDDVIELKTYHVFDSPHFGGDKQQQINAFIEVKDELFEAPYPAWTLLGIDGLFMDHAVIEVGLTAYLPDHNGCDATR